MADNVVDSLAIEIEANASQSVDGIKRLSRALTSLATSTAKVNSAGLGNVVSQVQRLSSVTTSAGTGATNASNGTRKYSNALNLLTSSSGRAEKSTKSLAYYFGKIYANCFLAIRGFKAIGNAINSAMDYIEAFNFFDVAISTAVAKGDDWANAGYQNAQEYATAFKQGLGNLNEKMTGFSVNSDTGDVAPSSKANLGINITDLETFESEIVSVTSSLGLATQASYDTSKGLAMLAADMSSLHNIDLKTVMQNFQSGIIGQSRALYKFGIDITAATLSTYAYKYGITKAVSEMTQAEKMQLRMLAILDQSKVAWGDLANTINQPANQLRVFTSGVKNLAITIGKLLLPIVSAVLPYLNAMVKALQRFFTWIANIAGIKLDAGNAGVGTSDIFDGIEDSADKADTSVGNLTNSVKELNKQLAPFDELNNMTTSNPSSGSNSGSGSGGSGGTVDLTDEINKALADYEKAWDEAYANMTDKATAMADTIVDAFKRKDYKGIGTYISNGLTNALNSIPWKTIYSVASEFGSGFAEFLNGLITPDLFYSVGKTIASALNTAIYTSLSFATTFDWGNLGESIAAGVNGFFENFDFKALGKAVNKWVKGIKKMIITAIKNIKWSDVFKAIYDFLSELDVDTITIIIGAFVIKYAGKLLTSSIFKELLVEKLLGSGITASGIASGVAAALTIGAVIAVSIQLVKDTNDWMNYLGADNLWDALTNKKYDDKKKEYADKNPANPYENGRALSDSDMEDIENSIKDWWQGVTDWWTGTTLYRFITNPTEMLEGAKSGLSTAWDNLTSDFKDWTFDVSAQLTTTAENVQEWWGNVKEWWGDKKVSVQSTIDNFKQKISDKWNDAKQWWDNSRPHLSDVKAAVDDFKERVGEKWNTAKQWWDNNKPDLNEIKSKIESVKDRVSGAWKNATDWWGRKTSLSQIKTTMESVSQRVREKWNEAKAWWSSKSPLNQITTTVENISSKVRDKWNGVKSYWSSKSPLSNITANVSDFVESVRERWNNLYNWWSGLSLPKIFANISLPHLSVSWSKVGSISVPSFSVEYYAKGGFPDIGTTFVAGEAGAEMVGNINGKTGVASNQEITGIREAVYDAGEAQLAELREQNALLRQLLAKDMGISARDVFNAVRQEDENYENMTGHSAFVR
ncbi:MAG: hypothetical protein SPJ65_05970 [Roseburia sp.]|nr:hypothetical protein [Roseburia sp.]